MPLKPDTAVPDEKNGRTAALHTPPDRVAAFGGIMGHTSAAVPMLIVPFANVLANSDSP